MHAGNERELGTTASVLLGEELIMGGGGGGSEVIAEVQGGWAACFLIGVDDTSDLGERGWGGGGGGGGTSKEWLLFSSSPWL